MENNPSLAAAVLESASSRALGTTRLAKELRIGPARLIRIVRDLRDEGLVGIQTVHAESAGRPLVKVTPTPLGEEYLKAYKALNSKTLKSRPSDLRRAVADARYARRLAERGLSPISLFLELNSLVVPLRRPAV